jgi:hypothetical protein
VIPSVTVTITNTQTGVVTNAVTNGSGLYDVPSLLPGTYNVSFKRDGFRDFVQQGHNHNRGPPPPSLNLHAHAS